MRVRCTTKFDITPTGVRGRSSRGADTMSDWHHARNQQRNWETVNQILSLRTLPTNITQPEKSEDLGLWIFEFEIEQPGAWTLDQDPLGALKSDCRDVPMIVGLTENHKLDPYLVPDENITFTIVDK